MADRHYNVFLWAIWSELWPHCRRTCCSVTSWTIHSVYSLRDRGCCRPPRDSLEHAPETKISENSHSFWPFVPLKTHIRCWIDTNVLIAKGIPQFPTKLKKGLFGKTGHVKDIHEDMWTYEWMNEWIHIHAMSEGFKNIWLMTARRSPSSYRTLLWNQLVSHLCF